MKKIAVKIALSLMALILTMTSSGFAQQTDNSLYLKVHAGYSLFSLGGDPLLSSPGFLYAPQGQLVTLNSNTRSGEGLNLGFGLEKEIGKVVLLGIDVNYLDGKKFKSMGTEGPLIGAAAQLQYSWNATGIQSVWSAVPAISFKVLPKSNYYIYTRLGLILAFDTKYHDDESFPSNDGYPGFKEIDNYKYGLSAGVQAAIGVQFKLQRNLKGFVELSNSFIDASPNSLSTNSTDSNGGSSQVYNQKYTYFKSNSGNYTANNTTNKYSVPSIEQHFNSTVLNIGLAFAIK